MRPGRTYHQTPETHAEVRDGRYTTLNFADTWHVAVVCIDSTATSTNCSTSCYQQPISAIGKCTTLHDTTFTGPMWPLILTVQWLEVCCAHVTGERAKSNITLFVSSGGLSLFCRYRHTGSFTKTRRGKPIHPGYSGLVLKADEGNVGRKDNCHKNCPHFHVTFGGQFWNSIPSSKGWRASVHFRVLFCITQRALR